MNNDWRKYNQACKQLVVAFLKRYYPEESLDTVYFVGGEKYTGVFECCGRYYYSIDFVQECLKLDATFEDIESYKDYKQKSVDSMRETTINFERWVKYPSMRKTVDEAPLNDEGLLVKCIPALEGITHYEDLLKEIEKRLSLPF